MGHGHVLPVHRVERFQSRIWRPRHGVMVRFGVTGAAQHLVAVEVPICREASTLLRFDGLYPAASILLAQKHAGTIGILDQAQASPICRQARESTCELRDIDPDVLGDRLHFSGQQTYVSGNPAAVATPLAKEGRRPCGGFSAQWSSPPIFASIYLRTVSTQGGSTSQRVSLPDSASITG